MNEPIETDIDVLEAQDRIRDLEVELWEAERDLQVERRDECDPYTQRVGHTRPQCPEPCDSHDEWERDQADALAEARGGATS